MPDFTVALHEGDIEELLEFFHMSTGLESAEGVRHLIAIEKTRGTRYFTAMRGGQVIGMVGVWFDTTGATAALEPPQIIDVAVHPEHRRGGVGRALVERAVEETRTAGFNCLWLYTDGGNADNLRFYLSLDFQLIAAVPDWFGKGSAKAIFRRDFPQETHP